MNNNKKYNKIIELQAELKDKEKLIEAQSQKEHLLLLRDDLEIAHIIPKLRL
jgi:hypothetical protein